MSRTTKRFLSILLAAAMILSLGITGWAIDDIGEIEIVEATPKAPVKTDEHVTEPFEGGTELEMREIDPGELSVSRHGEFPAHEEAEATEEAPFGPDDVVRVSIVLDKPATIDWGYGTKDIVSNANAMSYRQSLRNDQADVQTAIAASGISINVKWNLTLAVNLISAEVRFGDIEAIEAIPGVRAVWLETRYEPQADTPNTAVSTQFMVGAADAWAEGYTGAGSRIAIIDTGANQDHISFADDALLYALDEDGGDYDLLGISEIKAVLKELNANNAAAQHDISSPYYVYKNAKIPFAFNYVDGNNTTDHFSDSQGNHGSHVAGIAAANRYVKVDGAFVDAIEAVGAIGVAPDAQLLVMKVFGAGGGAYDSDYMAAIEDAIILKADSVNLSLGSASPGFSFSNGYQDVMDGLIESGTVVCMSGGNSGSWADNLSELTGERYPYLYLEDISLHTGGSPGSFVNSLASASADNIGVTGKPLTFSGYDALVFFNETDGYGNEPIATLAGSELEFVLVDGPGVDDNDHVGAEGDAFLALGSEVLSGKVAMCYRGSSSFFAKANAAAAQGAAAVIVINNQPGVINMNLTGYLYTAPAVSIQKADGDAIMAAAEAVTDEEDNVLYYKGTMSISDEISFSLSTDRFDATVSSFSAWGVPGSLIMKPEITSPGGSIYSVDGMTGDGYTLMSGTSMASPHTAGLAAVLGQYIRENDLESATGLNRRTLINSLLMSTATPMINDGSYVPVLQQGSGLADVSAAIQAKSYILMDDNATASAADGKVKVELGADAARAGSYSYSFTVNNFSDIDLFYAPYTDLFTQYLASDGENFYLLPNTLALGEGEDFVVRYDYPTFITGHDVNKDGATNRDDVQALLDYVAGNVKASKLDLAAGEMDGVEGISSYDAQLLLEWMVGEGVDYLVVPAGESVRVTVSFALTEDTKAFLNYYFTNGAYLEGFTYLFNATETEDGEILDATHSIPILGFFGSWTDASMFDCSSIEEILYNPDSTKIPYTGNYVTNYMEINAGKGVDYYFANNYISEDEYYPERLAINPKTQIVDFKYNLIRNASTTGWIALDENLNVLDSKLGGSQIAAFYHVNQGVWMNYNTLAAKVNTTAEQLGLKEGDTFTIGYFAIPEYYGMLLHPGESVNTVTADEAAALLASGELGDGAWIGYTLKVDATAPEILSATLSEDGTAIAVKVKDNGYLAEIELMDYTGSVSYAWTLPEQTEEGEEIEVTFDISELELPNGLAVFAADYAQNESAKLLILDPEQPVTKDVWVLTDELVPENYYVISSGAEGTVSVLDSYGVNYLTGTEAATVVSDANGVYIPATDVLDSSVWYCTEDYQLVNASDNGYLGYYQWTAAFANWGRQDYGDVFTYADGMLYNDVEEGEGLYFYNGDFIWYEAGPVFLFTPTEIEVDPTAASSVTVSPSTATLILDVIPTVQLMAKVEPIVLEDMSVAWTSSDETVATVDETGLVTAVGVGTAVITAASNQTPEVVDTATINVTAGEPMDAVVYGQATIGEEIVYGEIDLNDMSVSDLSGGAMFSAFTGGGRSGDFIYGNDVDNDFHRYNAEENFAYDSDYHFVISDSWAAYDIACFPAFAIADYTGLTAEDEPVVTEYNRIFAALNSSSCLYFVNEEGSLTYFDLSSLGNFIAVSFAGASLDEDGLPNLYYILLGDDGSLIRFVVYPNLSDGGLSASYDVLGYINVLSIGEDKSLYSLSYYETEDDYGVFVADGSVGGIYWVSLNEVDENGEVDAHFVGKIDGAETLSSLSDFYYDTIGSFGFIPVGLTVEEPEAIPGSALVEAVRGSFSTTMVLQSEEAFLFEGAEDDIVIGGDDDGIVLVGGLDALNTLPVRSGLTLNAAELLNPETYEADDLVAISLTAPDGEEGEWFYNGKLTVKYDPNALVLDSIEAMPGVEFTSCKVNEEKGRITFAFAGMQGIEPNGVLAIVCFTGLSQDTTVTVKAVESNDKLDFNEVTTIELESSFELALTDGTTAGVQLDWTAVDGAEKYEAQVKAGDEWKSLGEFEELTAIDPDVLMAETYTYRVRAFRNGAWTGFCKEQSIRYNAFSDVSGNKTIEYVGWAYNNGVVNGTSNSTFSPDDSCTRLQFVMMLWKASGSPKAEGELPFSDVSGAKSTKAVLWALNEGIINSAAKFYPENSISRDQIVMILWKMNGSPKVEGEFPFTDVEGAKTQKAVLWAYQNGIVKGTSETTFSPKDDCTRVQLVVLLYKYDQNFGLLPKA